MCDTVSLLVGSLLDEVVILVTWVAILSAYSTTVASSSQNATASTTVASVSGILSVVLRGP